MLFLIFCFVAPRKKEPRVVEMDSRRFRKSINRRRMSDVWVTLFTSKEIPGHVSANSILDESFSLPKGFVKFAYLDSSKNAYIPNKLNLHHFPCFCIFHYKGYECKNASELDAREIVNWASSFLIDFSDYADESWLEKHEQEPSVILFTEKTETPLMWVGISNEFRKSSLKIAVSNNTNLAETKFNIHEFPTILMHNFSHNIIYNGPNDYQSLTSNFKLFAQRKYQKSGSKLYIHKLDDFDNYCKEGNVCIIKNDENIDNNYDLLRRKHTTSFLQFFYGSKLPKQLSCLENTPFLAYSPLNNGYIKIENITQLQNIINSILDKKEEWIPLPTEL